jgi:hypothetical protein
MTLSRIVAFTLLAITSACGGQSSVAPTTTPSPAASGSTAPAAADSSQAAADTSAASAATTPAAPPKCVAQGKSCTIGDTWCCYGACRVYNGSATPVCAP